MIDMEQEKAPKRKPRGKKIVRREIKKKVSVREPRLVGYMRVSTEKQDHALQYDAMIEAGIAPEDIFQDTISGKKISRTGLEACFKHLVAGDTLLVWKVDRFSRRLADMVLLMRRLEEMKVGFRSLTQPFDTTTPAGKMMLGMLSIFAEFERDMIVERVKSGIQAVRNAEPDRRWGKKPSVEYDEAEILRLLKTNSVRGVTKITGVPKSTVQAIKDRSRRK